MKSLRKYLNHALLFLFSSLGIFTLLSYALDGAFSVRVAVAALATGCLLLIAQFGITDEAVPQTAADTRPKPSDGVPPPAFSLKGRRTISLEELSWIWKQQRQPQTTYRLPGSGPAYRDPAIREFHSEIASPESAFAGNPKWLAAAERLLSILDRYGDCPSVIETDSRLSSGRREYNHELKYRTATGDTSLFDVFRKVSLRDHTLAVARTIRRECGGCADEPLLILAALAHDIGKVPAWREQPRYSCGDHAATGALILKTGIPEFKNLSPSEAQAIESAVMEHHMDKPRGHHPFSAALRKADQMCRSADISRLAGPQQQKETGPSATIQSEG